MSRREGAVIWVCQCCMLMHANGECCADSDHGGDGVAPWSVETGEVAMGLLSSEHAEDCAVRITGSWPVDYECDCERREFDLSSCDGCGSRLGGKRHAFTAWIDREGD